MRKSDWKPISTLPKTDGMFLLFDPGVGVFIGCRDYQLDENDRPVFDCDVFCELGAGETCDEAVPYEWLKPTKWMHIIQPGTVNRSIGARRRQRLAKKERAVQRKAVPFGPFNV